MRKIMISMLFCLFCIPAFADVSINDVLNKAGAKEGVLYDANANRTLNFLAATIFNGSGVMKDFSVVAGLVSTDGVGVATDYDLGKALPVISFPVVSLFNELHVGLGGYVRTITVHTDAVENSKADNKWGWGPTAFIKWSF